ncbi:LPXTG-motif protein cell wall anchor domain protein [Umbribacter vaginalis]|nr:LPXTG-motif protein cell wall anchor domain protein [Coriobacteriales bacterium DNF00809]
MDTKTITAQTKKAVAIGLCASLIGGVAAPVLNTSNVAYAAVASKPQVNTAHSSIIQFKDQVLKERILSKMKKQNLIDQSAQDITEADALKVTEVWFPGNRIKSIKGLEFFKNLTTLHLSDNQISDISALADLPNLTSLDLSNNKISDMTFLRELGNPFEDKTTLNAKDQTITLRPGTSKVNLAKEIKGFGHVAFKSDENIVDDVLTYKDGMQNPYTVNATDGFKYSATINIDFSQAKKELGERPSSETQAEDISLSLERYLGAYNQVIVTDNYTHADDNLKQAYDTAITDGKKVYDKLSSTPEQVKQATEQIKTTLGALNGDKKAQAIKEQLSTATQQISSLQSELEKAKQQGTTDKSKIEELNGQISTLNGQLEKLKSNKTLSEQQKQTEIDKLNGQITNLGKQIEQLTQENTTLKGQVASLQEQLGKLQGQLQTATEQGVADKATIERLTGQVASLSSQLDALKADKTRSDQEKQREIEQLTAQLATFTQEKQGLQGKLDAANEKISTFTQQLQQAQIKADADKKQLQELTNALQQAKQQLEQLKSDKTKSDEQKQQEIDMLNAKIAELEKKVQTCSAQVVGGSIVAPLINEKPTFDIEKYKREHNYMLPGIATHTYQTKQDTFTSDVHAALQQLVPMAASTNAAAQATAQRTDESERAQAEQKADTSSKQEADKTKLDQNKFPQTGDNSLLTLLSTFAGALVLVLGCFARKKSSKANKR